MAFVLINVCWISAWKNFFAIVFQTVLCEGGSGHLYCTGNSMLIITSVIYGRFSRVICPSSNNIYEAMNCKSINALQIVKESCEGKMSCTINANSDTFGDPCYNTKKYLSLQYDCRKLGNALLSWYEANFRDQASSFAPIFDIWWLFLKSISYMKSWLPLPQSWQIVYVYDFEHSAIVILPNIVRVWVIHIMY